MSFGRLGVAGGALGKAGFKHGTANINFGQTAAFDAVTTSNANGPSTFTHTPNGTPTAVFALAHYFGNLTGITYGGTSMSSLASVNTGAGSTIKVWGLANPSAGVQSVITSGLVNQTVHVISVTGSDTASLIRASATNVSSDTSPTVTCQTTISDLVICIAGDDDATTPTYTATGLSTQRGTMASNGFIDSVASSASGTSSDIDMTWTASSAIRWATIALSVKHG